MQVLYACFKRKLHSEMKVAQLAGYVSEQTAYHHGEASLHSTIVHMAQNFAGSNNVPLLYPAGQFGTRCVPYHRATLSQLAAPNAGESMTTWFTFYLPSCYNSLQGGKDAASARYIFTRLDPAARLLFREEDDHLLNYLDEDGEQVQPQYFVPVLPTILLNGCEGLGAPLPHLFTPPASLFGSENPWCRRVLSHTHHVCPRPEGTGWSTQIPSYNPLQIIENLTRRMEGKQMNDMAPWYRGLQGPILRKKGSPNFVSIGLVEKVLPPPPRPCLAAFPFLFLISSFPSRPDECDDRSHQ
jgi:DNA topoisomerase-2